MKEVMSMFNVLSNEEREKWFNDMSRYQRNLFYELEKDENKQKDYNLNDLIFDFDKEFVERILELELEQYLTEHPEENRKNGYTNAVEIVVGNKTINFNRPRLRKEKDFNSELIPKRKKFIDDISDYVITLYSKNNSVNDIKEILKEMFDLDISTAKISELSQSISKEILVWRNRELNKCYFTAHIDCTYIKIRDKKNLVSHKIPIYIVVGTKLDGHKEIIGMYLGNEDEEKNVIDGMYNVDIGESKTFWLTIFNDLKDRGVKRILYIISDGLKGMEDAVKSEFPTTTYQRCVVHLVRNLKKYVSKQESAEIVREFKKIYTAVTKKESENSYKEFINKYSKKRTLIKHVEEYYGYIIGLYELPENIRKYIYTNNVVESANSKIKRGFYGRGALPNVESAINIIYVNLKDLEKKWKEKKVNNWEKIFNEIIMVHEKEIKEYI